MTVTHQDIGKDGVTARRYRRWEMPFAVALSFLCPGLGVAALGLSAQVSRWEVTRGIVSQVAFLFLFLSQLISTWPFWWLLLAGLWLISGTVSAVRTLYLLPTLRAGVEPRQTHYLGAFGLLFYLVCTLSLFAMTQRLTDLTIRPAAPGTVLAPAGTTLIAIEPAFGDRYARGELIEYSTSEGPRLARVLAVGGDWFAPEVGGFVVNAHRYSAPPGRINADVAPRYLEGLDDPSGYRRFGKDLPLMSFAGLHPRRVPPRQLVVASDDALTADIWPPQVIRTEVIDEDAVLAVPLARLDKPFAGRAALFQPAPSLRFLFSRP